MRLKYPKFSLLILTFVAAYIFFKISDLTLIRNFISSLGYLGAFIAGIMYVYSFTAAPATVILLVLSKSQNILLTGFIAGFGALLGDFVIFKFMRNSMQDEFDKLSNERPMRYLDSKIPKKIKNFIGPAIAFITIASPLPDEIGVMLLAQSRLITTRIFNIISYIVNTGGIFVVLYIGTML